MHDIACAGVVGIELQPNRAALRNRQATSVMQVGSQHLRRAVQVPPLMRSIECGRYRTRRRSSECQCDNLFYECHSALHRLAHDSVPFQQCHGVTVGTGDDFRVARRWVVAGAPERGTRSPGVRLAPMKTSVCRGLWVPYGAGREGQALRSSDIPN